MEGENRGPPPAFTALPSCPLLFNNAREGLACGENQGSLFAASGMERKIKDGGFFGSATQMQKKEKQTKARSEPHQLGPETVFNTLVQSQGKARKELWSLCRVCFFT